MHVIHTYHSLRGSKVLRAGKVLFSLPLSMRPGAKISVLKVSKQFLIPQNCFPKNLSPLAQLNSINLFLRRSWPLVTRSPIILTFSISTFHAVRSKYRMIFLLVGVCFLKLKFFKIPPSLIV